MRKKYIGIVRDGCPKIFIHSDRLQDRLQENGVKHVVIRANCTNAAEEFTEFMLSNNAPQIETTNSYYAKWFRNRSSRLGTS